MGKIQVDHTGAGGGITLSSDGTDLLLDGTAIGGGGGAAITVDAKTASYTVVSEDVGKLITFTGNSYTATLTAAATLGHGFFVYIENNAASGQNGHVVTIDGDGSETIDYRTTMPLRQGERVLLVCDGTSFKTVSSFHRGIATNCRTDFFGLPQATGDESVSIGLGSVASATNTTAIGLNTAATANYATAFGMAAEATAFGAMAAGYNSISAGSQSVALGVSRASGTDSFAAAIANNTATYGATGANSVAIGQTNKATSTGGLALGRNAISTAQDAVSIGLQCTADATNSIALGAYSSTKGIKGRIAFSGVSSNYQQGTFVLAQQTADATPSVLTYNTTAASTDNQVILPNKSAFAFSGTIVARQQDPGTACAAWKIEGLIRREGSAGTTVLVNSATTVLDNTPAWGMALTADTTNGGLKIEVTGAAATNIRWVATINTSEVTYA